MAYSRELLTYWLATSDDGAELWAEYEDMRQSLGATGVLATKVGRHLTLRVVDSLFEYTDPIQRQRALDA